MLVFPEYIVVNGRYTSNVKVFVGRASSTIIDSDYYESGFVCKGTTSYHIKFVMFSLQSSYN